MSDVPRIGLGEGAGHEWHYPVPVVLRKGLDPKMPKVGHRSLQTVVLDDDGLHVGCVSVLVGCAVKIEVQNPDGTERATYYFNPTELFEAVQLVHNAGQPGFELPPVAVPVLEPPKVADAVVPDGSVEYRIIGGDAWGGTEMFEVSRGTDLARQWVMLRETLGKDDHAGPHHFRAQVRHVGPWVDHEDSAVAVPVAEESKPPDPYAPYMEFMAEDLAWPKEDYIEARYRIMGRATGGEPYVVDQNDVSSNGANLPLQVKRLEYFRYQRSDLTLWIQRWKGGDWYDIGISDPKGGTDAGPGV